MAREEIVTKNPIGTRNQKKIGNQMRYKFVMPTNQHNINVNLQKSAILNRYKIVSHLDKILHLIKQNESEADDKKLFVKKEVAKSYTNTKP